MATILVQTHTLRQRIKTVFAPTALALFLSACSGSGFFTNEVTESLKQEAYATSEFYINHADRATDNETRQSYRLLAIRKLIDENKAVEAQNTLSELSPEFNETQRLEYQLLQAELSALQGRNEQAKSLLSVLQLPQLSRSQQLRFYQTQARLAENKNDVIEAVRARIASDHLLTDNRSRQENNDKIWHLLRNANRGMLENTPVAAGEIGLAGWLSLVLTYNQQIANPAQLPQSLTAWKAQYPTHSAAILLPTELQGVSNFQQTQLNSVALLLPLSGDAKALGEMIKKGFDDAKGEDPTAVQAYDTDSADIASLVTQAKQQGAQIIVGPLLKERVGALLADPQIQDLNVLTLNSTANERPIARVCYYGLAPEAEARSAADRLHQDGLSKAIVIAPQGDFGQRSADAFANRWLQLTNNDADVRYYHQPLDALAAIQNANASEGTGLYILGGAEQLLEIKQGIDNSPLAGKLAIYTSSRSNSPNNGPDFYQTMQGVKFSEIPLLADVNSDLYRKAEDLASRDFSMMRLYAMGSDAWTLANKFNELRQIPGYSLSGLTGKLSAGSHCNIQRSMAWLIYQNGTVQSAN